MRATAIGSLPGEDFRGAVAEMAETFPDLVPMPEQPGRGPGAGIIGRATGVLEELPVDLGPGGWRLSDSGDAAARAARSCWRRDLDDLEETLAGAPATVKIAVCGPLTLAAGLHLRHGEAVLADPGALREVAQSLAAGTASLLAELGRRMPQVRWVWQIDEPAAPSVLAGAVPTQSGLHRYRPMEPAVAIGVAAPAVEAAREAGAARTAWHSCAPQIPWELLRRIGIDDALVDLSALGSADLDRCAEWLESESPQGRPQGRLGLGAVPTGVPDTVLDADRIVDRVVEFARRIGVDRRLIVERGLLTPACGLTTWSLPAAARQCRQLARAAELADEALLG
ncbi:MAG: methionine synthase [Acidipropionibacterium sp.]|jgi:methionine synthase II (cobalamin-independent)|nr:methionine synthase [Acidipropionibacterium sp.]